MDLTDVNLLLSLLNILILLVCLYIIRDTITYIRESTSARSASAILYLKSDTVINGLKILMVAVIIWSIKRLIGFMRDYTSATEIPGYIPIGGINTSVFELMGLFVAVFLSYGLYIISVSFRTHVRGWDEKKKSGRKKKS